MTGTAEELARAEPVPETRVERLEGTKGGARAGRRRRPRGREREPHEFLGGAVPADGYDYSRGQRAELRAGGVRQAGGHCDGDGANSGGGKKSAGFGLCPYAVYTHHVMTPF